MYTAKPRASVRTGRSPAKPAEGASPYSEQQPLPHRVLLLGPRKSTSWQAGWENSILPTSPGYILFTCVVLDYSTIARVLSSCCFSTQPSQLETEQYTENNSQETGTGQPAGLKDSQWPREEGQAQERRENKIYSNGPWF